MSRAESLLEQEDRRARAYGEAFSRSLTGARTEVASVRESVLRELDELRDEILDRFRTALPGGYTGKVGEAQRSSIGVELDASLSTFERIADASIDSGIRQLSIMGGRITTDALTEAGIPVTEPFTESISDVFLSASKSISRLVESVRKRVMSGVDAAVAGSLDVISFLSLVKSILSTDRTDRGAGPRRSGPAYWLEKMSETLMLQGFSVSQQEASERLSRQVGGLRKTWVTAGDGKERRGHAEAQSRYGQGGEEGPIPVGQKFVVLDYSNTGTTDWVTLSRVPRRVIQVPKYHRKGSVQTRELLHPREPGAPVGMLANCRCVSMEVVDSFDAAFDQAAGIIRKEL